MRAVSLQKKMLIASIDHLLNSFFIFKFQKQEERLHHMLNILDRLIQEFPHAQQALRRVAVTYGPEPE